VDDLQRTSGLKKASPRHTLIQIKIQQMPARRFPSPWAVDAGFNCGVAKSSDLVKDLARRVRG
jgi:hypothetical protein